MVNRTLKDRDLGRVKLRFYQSAKVADLPVEVRNMSSGQVRIATPAVTALDLAWRPEHGAGLSNAPTVIVELAEDGKLEPQALLDVAVACPRPRLRVGWAGCWTWSTAVSTPDPLAAAVAERGSTATEDLARRATTWITQRPLGPVENVAVKPDL